jgi:hypothetical protein
MKLAIFTLIDAVAFQCFFGCRCGLNVYRKKHEGFEGHAVEKQINFVYQQLILTWILDQILKAILLKNGNLLYKSKSRKDLQSQGTRKLVQTTPIYNLPSLFKRLPR